MKKSIFSVIAIALVSVFAFTSCQQEQTKTEVLTQSKGWKMTEATCATGITTTTNNKIYDLMDQENGYFFACELDDILTFKEDGYVYFNPGKVVNDEGMDYYPAQETAMGKWTLDEENDILTTHFPWEYDFNNAAANGEPFSCKVVTLNKDKMKLTFTLKVEAGQAKDIAAGEYPIDIVFEPAK